MLRNGYMGMGALLVLGALAAGCSDDDGDSGGSSSSNGGADSGGADNGGADNGGADNGGADNGGADSGGADNGGADNGGAGSFELGIVHINDHHSRLEAGSLDLDLAGKETEVDNGGFPRVVTKIESVAAKYDNALKLHAGDAITGDLYYTLFNGQADADLMNEVCFDAFALGNHEFDGGDAGLVTFLDYLNPSGGSCTTPVLAANVVPEVGTPLAPTASESYLQPYVVKEFGDVKVGIIGIDIANKTKNSSSPLATTAFLDETTTAQQYIDELKGDGVEHIVLMTHYQYSNDLVLAGALDGVDVIVGGDSHTLLGDFADLGLNPGGDYPTEVTDMSGKKVCVVQAWEYSKVVGELAVSFDGAGDVTSCTGTPHLMLGDTFVREEDFTDASCPGSCEGTCDGTEIDGESCSGLCTGSCEYTVTGDDLAAIQTAIDGIDELSIVTPDADAAAKLATYSGQVDTLKAEKIGEATEDLCFERIPGQGRSSICDVTATEDNGSDITQIVAKAFRESSKRADIAIQNGGGVREDVAMGDITLGTAFVLMPFANTLVEMEMTGAEIKAVLEEAATFALDPDGSTGAYPYAAGLRWDVDLSASAGSRFTNLEVMEKGETTWTTLDTAATYVVVTNSFIAAGRDGYLTFGTIADDKKVDTFLEYAQTFVDYVKAVGTLSKLPTDEYSTQNFTPAN